MKHFCSIIKPKARSKSQLNASLTNAVIIAEYLNHVKLTRSMRLGAVTIKSSPTAISYPVLLNCFKPHLSTYQRTCLEMILKCHNLVIEGYKRCQLHQDLLVGFTQSQHRSNINYRDYRICYQEPGKHQRGFGEVKYFACLGELSN